MVAPEREQTELLPVVMRGSSVVVYTEEPGRVAALPKCLLAAELVVVDTLEEVG